MNFFFNPVSRFCLRLCLKPWLHWSLLFFLAFVLTAALLTGSAFAEKRTALVIGNGAYDTSPLKNPVNDATDMKNLLEALGFEVIFAVDADKGTMLKAVDQFSKRLSRSQVGLFYYAGHGMQINGNNFLIPTRAHITSETDVEWAALAAGRILGRMESAGTRLNIVILDACRDNPFERGFRSSAKGLARMKAPIGSIIAYSTSPGSVASDGQGRNGLYTAKLMEYMRKPGMKIEDVFKKTRIDVVAAAKRQGASQVPWESSSLMGDFYFTSSGAAPLYLDPVVVEKKTKEPATSDQNSGSEPGRGTTWTDPVAGMEFVWVPRGCFMMGSNDGDADEKPVHEVCLDGFWMGKFEVTQGEWSSIMGSNPSEFQKGDQFPVEMVSWNDVKNFINKLNAKTALNFALPTEAQWEYAATSCGTEQKYSGADDVESVAWCGANSGDSTHQRGTRAPNGLGIYDMIGNVCEWCEDIYAKDAYKSHAHNNPVYAESGFKRVIRGGSWFDYPGNLRCTYRNRDNLDERDSLLGFRLVWMP